MLIYDKNYLDKVDNIIQSLSTDDNLRTNNPYLKTDDFEIDALMSAHNVMPLASNVTTESITNYNGMRVVYSQISQSIANNTSVIRATVTHFFTGYSSSWGSNSTATITVDGQSKSLTVPPHTFGGANSRVIGTLDFTVSHSSNGSKSAAVKHYWNRGWGGGASSQGASSTFYFDTIPRASSFGTISGNTIGSSITVNISRKSSSFTHQVWYRLPGQAWVNLGTGITTSTTFTIPLDYCKFITNSTSGICEISIQTKSGSTNIGNEVRKNHTVHIPASVIPSFNTITHSENVTEVKDKVGAYVQNRSKLNLEIIDAVGIYGSTIKSYEIKLPGSVINKETDISNFITDSGIIRIIGTVTDSRGRKASKTVEINVLAYDIPKISLVEFSRSDENGNSSPEGDHIKIKMDISISSLINGVQKNTMKYEVQSAIYGNTYFETNKSETLSTITHTEEVIISGFIPDNSYHIILKVSDIFGEFTAFGLIPLGQVLQHWAKFTTAFGMLLPGTYRNIFVGLLGLESYGPLIDMNGNDLTVEYGEQDGIHWEKRPNGILEISGILITPTLAVNTNQSHRIDFPVFFKEGTNSENLNVICNVETSIPNARRFSYTNVTDKYFDIVTNSDSAVFLRIPWTVKGYWK